MVHAPDPRPEVDAREEAARNAAAASAEAGPAAPSASSAVAPEAAAARRLEAKKAAPPVDTPRPIGIDRLRALRDAIRNGTYPTQADVVGGLVKMFGEPDVAAEAEDGTD